MRVSKIEYAGKADVYNMEVEGVHSFIVNGGIVSHNCFDESRYFLMSQPVTPIKKPPRKQRLIADPFRSDEDDEE